MNSHEVPKDGINPYAHHPGFEAEDCELRITVTQRGPYGDLGNCGFSCSMSGGHCLPGSVCSERREAAARQDTARARFNFPDELMEKT